MEALFTSGSSFMMRRTRAGDGWGEGSVGCEHGRATWLVVGVRGWGKGEKHKHTEGEGQLHVELPGARGGSAGGLLLAAGGRLGLGLALFGMCVCCGLSQRAPTATDNSLSAPCSNPQASPA